MPPAASARMRGSEGGGAPPPHLNCATRFRYVSSARTGCGTVGGPTFRNMCTHVTAQLSSLCVAVAESSCSAAPLKVAVKFHSAKPVLYFALLVGRLAPCLQNNLHPFSPPLKSAPRAVNARESTPAKQRRFETFRNSRHEKPPAPWPCRCGAEHTVTLLSSYDRLRGTGERLSQASRARICTGLNLQKSRM